MNADKAAALSAFIRVYLRFHFVTIRRMSYPPPPYGYPPPAAGYGYATPAYVERPGVMPWFVAYAILMGLLYLAFAGFGVTVFVVGPDRFADAKTSAEEWNVLGVVFIAMGLGLGGVFGIAPFLPRRPWVWIYDLVLIALGLTSACLWPMTIPLLIFWIKPETKRWFGRNV
jgi:hypothetical protein